MATDILCTPDMMFYLDRDRVAVRPADAGKVTAEFVERLIRACEADA